MMPLVSLHSTPIEIRGLRSSNFDAQIVSRAIVVNDQPMLIISKVKEVLIVSETLATNPALHRPNFDVIEQVGRQFHVTGGAVQMEHAIRRSRGLVGRAVLSPPRRGSALRFSKRPVQLLSRS